MFWKWVFREQGGKQAQEKVAVPGYHRLSKIICARKTSNSPLLKTFWEILML
jgi:hypothetical protein